MAVELIKQYMSKDSNGPERSLVNYSPTRECVKRWSLLIPFNRRGILVRLIWGVVFLGILVAAQAEEESPGFSCEQAGSAAEALICSEPPLVVADQRLNEVYSQLRQVLEGEEWSLVVADQRDWLRERPDACDWSDENRSLAINCLLRYYRQRQQSLEWALNPDSAPTDNVPLQVERMTPSGADVNTVNQLVFQFNQPVVPVGDMLRDSNEIPITIRPEGFDCRWRWLNSSALACDVTSGHRLNTATRYEVHLDPLRAESGARMTEPFMGWFSSRMPGATSVRPSTWLGARRPVLNVRFNMPVTAASVAEAVKLDAAGSMHYALVPPDFDDWGSLEDRLVAAGEDTALMLFTNDVDQAAHSWELVPADPIPPEADAYLVKESAGLESPGGNQKSDSDDREVGRIEAYRDFRVVNLSCSSYRRNRGNLSLERLQSGAGRVCMPHVRPVLTFSAPVDEAQVAKHVLLEDQDTGEAIHFEVSSGRHNDGDAVRGSPRNFGFRTKRPLNSASRYRLVVGEEVVDAFGRSLNEALDGTFATTHWSPLLNYRQGNIVLESGRTTDAFIQVRNVESFDIRGTRSGMDNESVEFSETITTPGVDDKRYGIPLKLRELLGDDYTRMDVCLRWHQQLLPYPFNRKSQDTSLGHRPPCFSAQVTPFHVHAKVGRLGTLVWVTDLQTGLPVDGAKVEIAVRRQKDKPSTLTDAQGRAFFSASPESVWVQKDNASAYLEVGYQHAVRRPDYNNHHNMPFRQVWGFTPQGVYQAGDEVSVKGYYRQRDGENWVLPGDDDLILSVRDPRGELIHRVNRAKLSRFGTVTMDFTLAEDAASGTYTVGASRRYRSDGQPRTMGVGRVAQFVVSDFNPVEIDVNTEILGDAFSPGDTLRYRVSSAFMSGGAYANARARITGRLILEPEVRAARGMEGFQFPRMLEEHKTIRLFERDIRLDENGEFEGEAVLRTQTDTQGAVVVDASVIDERGQQIAAHSRAPFSGRDAFPGLKVPWEGFQKAQEGMVEVIVVDGQGRPLEGRSVTVVIEQAVVSRVRIKESDESYETRDHVSWETVQQCALVSESTALECRFTPDTAGELRVTATLEEGVGQPIRHRVLTLVRGDGPILWTHLSGNQLQITPKQTSVKVGDVASYLVRNPYPGSQALITLERAGVIYSFVQEFSGSVEQVEFPVTAEHVPGYYLSVVVAAPRADDEPPTGNADLGQPTFATGYVRTRVPTQVDRLHLSVTPEKQSYAPGEEARVTLVLDDQNGVDPENVEVAVLVLDEGVLALNPFGLGYYDLYRQWHRLYGLGVANYNLLTRLSDKVAFDGKGTTPGGDGDDGPDGPLFSFRDHFKYLIHWEPAQPLEADGRATFTFTLPDNLTRWRVIAIASDTGQRAGYADETFISENPTEVRAAFPNQVTVGDEFVARFTVMNRSNETRELTIDWQTEGPVADRDEAPVTTVTLEPYQRKTLDRPMTAEGSGVIEFTVSAGDELHRDGLRHRLNVFPVRNQEVAASYGSTDGERAMETLLPPHDLDPSFSRAEAVVTPTVLGVGDGALRYLEAYSYSGWESTLSRALGAGLSTYFTPWMVEPTEKEDADAQVDAMFRLAPRLQLSNGAMTFWSRGQNRTGHAFLSAYTVVVFEQLRSLGYTPPEAVESGVRGYLKNLLRRDAGFSDQYGERARLSLRAQILHALAIGGHVDQDELDRLEQYVGAMDLSALSSFLHAQVLLGAEQDAIRDTVDRILSNSRQDSGTVYFAETEAPSYSYDLGSTLKTQCQVLSALAAAELSAPGGYALNEVPYRLMRFITQGREGKDHWLNTQENAYCLMAIRAFADAYESVEPSAVVQVVYGKEPLGSVELTARSQSATVFDIDGDRLVPGVGESVQYQRDGQGRFYHAVRMYFNRTGEAPTEVNAGLAVSREYSVLKEGQWRQLADDAVLERGDVVRVEIQVETDVPRHFVVADDQVPGAFEPISTELATGGGFGGADVAVQIRQFPQDHPADFYSGGFVYHEMNHDAVRFYSDYLPAGRYNLSYTLQVVAAGTFHAHPVKASEMYNPETFGLGKYRQIQVKE